MDVREKYVMQKVSRKEKSICQNCIHHNLCIAENNQPCFECNRFIDAHGVTVQEWISVKERKPDLELVEAKGDDFDLYVCLVTIKNDRARNGRYVGKAWYDGERFVDSDCVDITYNVTHWMHLPQPPKGE